MTIEGLLIRIRNYYIRATAKNRRKRIKHTDFTVISNNCWSGLLYESYGLRKQSPTIGMYFMADEYVKFLSNLEYYFNCEIEFVEPEKAVHKDFYAKDKRFGTYPIAKVGDVEIAMLHFHSQEEAKEKWERRCKRVNWSKMIIKMNDQNECTEAHAKIFGQLPYKNKVFFTVNDFDAGDCTVRFPAHGEKSINGLQEPFGKSKHVDVNELINKL